MSVFDDRGNIRTGRAWTYGLILLAIAAGITFAIVHAYLNSTRNVTVNIRDKARVCSSGNSGCQYLIYTDHGTFKDTDSYLSGKFSSSDLYGQLDRGGEYELKVRGYRVPFLSEYPNVLEVVSTIHAGSVTG